MGWHPRGASWQDKNACKVRYKVLENNQKDKAYKEMAERVGGIFNNFSKLEKYLPMLRELAVLHKNVAKAKSQSRPYKALSIKQKII